MRILCGVLAFSLVTSAAIAGVVPPDPPVHTIDTALAAADQTPPSNPVITAVTLEQYDDAPSNARCSASSTLTIELAPMSDDHSDVQHLGYEIRVVSGALPKGLQLPTAAVRPSEFGSYNPPRLTWAFGRSNETVSFALAVTAVDEAGNRSAQSAAVEETGTATGCNTSTTTRGSLASLLLVFGAVAFVARRQRETVAPALKI